MKSEFCFPPSLCFGFRRRRTKTRIVWRRKKTWVGGEQIDEKDKERRKSEKQREERVKDSVHSEWRGRNYLERRGSERNFF